VLLREMSSQVLRIGQVLQEYLRFARMPKSERAVVSLKGFLEEKLNFVQPLLDQKHVELRSRLDPNLPPVQVDAEQLWEAILNLISNALDAMPDGGNLTVSAQRHGAEDHCTWAICRVARCYSLKKLWTSCRTNVFWL